MSGKQLREEPHIRWFPTHQPMQNLSWGKEGRTIVLLTLEKKKKKNAYQAQMELNCLDLLKRCRFQADSRIMKRMLYTVESAYTVQKPRQKRNIAILSYDFFPPLLQQGRGFEDSLCIFSKLQNEIRLKIITQIIQIKINKHNPESQLNEREKMSKKDTIA